MFFCSKELRLERRLNKLREQIKRIDTLILKDIKRRMNLSKKIGQIKRELNLEITDLKQEKKVEENYVKWAKRLDLDENSVEKIRSILIQESKKNQKE